MAKRLELVWPHKGEHVLQNPETQKWEFCGSDALLPRPLIEIEAFGSEKNKRFDPQRSNLLIKGENLFALQSLLPYYAGQVKVIYIDPPFNTKQQQPDYNDNFEHSVWLSWLSERIKISRLLLKEEGVLFVHLDQSEMAYLKVELDNNIFGRNNYVDMINIMMRHPERILKADMDMHQTTEYVLIYKNSPDFEIYKEQIDVSDISKYVFEVEVKKVDEKINIGEREIEISKPGSYEVIRHKAPNKSLLSKENIRESFWDRNSSGRFYSRHLLPRLRNDGYGTLYKVPGIGADEIGHRYFLQPAQRKFKNGIYFQGYPITKENFKEIPLPNFLDLSEIMASKQLSEEGGVKFPRGKKTEYEILYLIKLAKCEQGDLCLDFFAGSGTTAAVAHKLGMRWIIVESEEQAEEKCLIRMQAIVDGRDEKGVTKEIDWQGGGGFRFLEVGAPLLVKDAETKLTIINPHYTNGPLVRAVCAIEGFLLTGDRILHGKNGEHYAHVTEEFVDDSLVKKLKRKLKDEQFLTIYAAKGTKRRIQLPKEIRVKRISKDLVKKYVRNR